MGGHRQSVDAECDSKVLHGLTGFVAGDDTEQTAEAARLLWVGPHGSARPTLVRVAVIALRVHPGVVRAVADRVAGRRDAEGLRGRTARRLHAGCWSASAYQQVNLLSTRLPPSATVHHAAVGSSRLTAEGP